MFWGSGNFGEPPNISLFFDRRESENLTVFATGIGDTRHDLVLLVEVSADAKVSFTPISLTGEDLKGVEQFDLAANRKVAKEWYDLNWDFLVMKPRLNPPGLLDKIGIVLDIRYFWHGVVITSAIWLGLLLSIAIVLRLRARSS